MAGLDLILFLKEARIKKPGVEIDYKSLILITRMFSPGSFTSFPSFPRVGCILKVKECSIWHGLGYNGGRSGKEYSRHIPLCFFRFNLRPRIPQRDTAVEDHRIGR
jgi:hypothetical protein